MLPDSFEFFDGVSVWGVVVFERFDALRPDFTYQANAVLLLIPGPLNITVMTLLIYIVFGVAEV